MLSNPQKKFVNQIEKINLKNKVLVYTALFNDYDVLKEPYCKEKNTEYFCFTNNNKLKSKIWKCIVIKNIYRDYRRSARFIKLLPQYFFYNCNISVWVDASCKIKDSINGLIKESGTENQFILYKHRQRNCGCECLLGMSVPYPLRHPLVSWRHNDVIMTANWL